MWFSIILLLEFLFILIVVNNGDSTAILPKIIGGGPVQTPTEFPFMVSMRLDNRHICGGSIIDYRHILTAAHCCFNSANKRLPPEIVSVSAGSVNITSTSYSLSLFRRVEKVIVHKDYDPEGIAHDIAILRILGRFPNWTSTIQPVPLAAFTPVDYNLCTVCGWGVTKENSTHISNQLRAVNVPIVPELTCRSYYGKQISNKMICAGNRGSDSCQGDSGGPLICNRALTGIVSWGSGCAVYPGVYTAVPEYVSWIRKHSGKSSNFEPIKFSSTIIIVLVLILLQYSF